MARMMLRAGEMPAYTAAAGLAPTVRSSYPQRVCQTYSHTSTEHASAHRKAALSGVRGKSIPSQAIISCIAGNRACAAKSRLCGDICPGSISTLTSR